MHLEREQSDEHPTCISSHCRKLRATKRGRNALAWVPACAGAARVSHSRCGIRGTLCRQHPVVCCASPPTLHGHRRCLQWFWAADTRRATASRARPFTRLLCYVHSRSSEYFCPWVLVGRGFPLLAQVGRPPGAPGRRLSGYLSYCGHSWGSHTSMALVVPGPCYNLAQHPLHTPLPLRVSERALCPALDALGPNPGDRVLGAQRILLFLFFEPFLSLPVAQ